MTHYFPGEHCVLVWMSLCIVFPQVHGRGSGFGGGCGGEQREWISVSEKNLASLSPHFCNDIASNISSCSVSVGLIPLLTFLCLMTLPVTYLGLYIVDGWTSMHCCIYVGL